jgi:squalene monooxygenase
VTGPGTHDVIIAGGGVAGTAAAAAFARLNYRVLIVEPGLDHARRLAGELIHPPGVADFRALGLLECLRESGAVPVHGFAVYAGAAEVLRYDEIPGLKEQGLAIEHGAMARALLTTVEKLSNVTVRRGARVVGVDLSNADFVTVTLTHEGRESQQRAAVLVAADGRSSQVRRMAGIGVQQVHISNMTGFVLNDVPLPHPGFGHVFADGTAPVLAYEISAQDTRIMFDVPIGAGGISPYVERLPASLRTAAEKAINTQTPLGSANYSVVPEAVVKRRVVCVGDSGGCCHPVTATGLSACARDAVRLSDTVRDTGGDMAKALPQYARLREGPQRARMAGAEALYEVLKGGTPEMCLLRQGLFRYWHESPRGRAATMALLSTYDDRVFGVVREYLQVSRYALAGLGLSQQHSRAMFGLPGAVFKVLRRTLIKRTT